MWGLLLSLIPKKKIASAVYSALPPKYSDEIREHVQTSVQSVIGRTNLVTREKVEEQEKQLLQLREKIEAMEELVVKLEQQKQTSTSTKGSP
jgi:BMFP domain-containing protein YqiC